MTIQTMNFNFEYIEETVEEKMIGEASKRFHDWMSHISFIYDVSELNRLKSGALVEVNLIGPMVYEGRINELYAFMTRTAPGTDEPSEFFIYSFRGKEPYIAKDRTCALGFKRWIRTEVYSIFENPMLFARKSKLMGAVGQ